MKHNRVPMHKVSNQFEFGALPLELRSNHSRYQIIGLGRSVRDNSHEQEWVLRWLQPSNPVECALASTRVAVDRAQTLVQIAIRLVPRDLPSEQVPQERSLPVFAAHSLVLANFDDSKLAMPDRTSSTGRRDQCASAPGIVHI